MKPLKVAIVSIGGAGYAHVARFGKNPKACVRAVFDINENRLKAFSRLKSKDTYVATDYDDILNDSEIDIVSICSPDHTHFNYAIKAIRANKHVLIEKPMVVSLEECKEIQEALFKTDITFGVHFQMRYVPCFNCARDAIMRGEIGVPFVVEADYIHDMRERAALNDNWRIDRNSPQRVVLGASSHAIDLVRWAINDEVVEVFSYATHVGWPEYPDEDTVLTILKFKNGAVGKVLSTIASSRPQMNSLVVYGARGSITNNLLIGKGGVRKIIYVPGKDSIKNRFLNLLGTLCINMTRSAQNYPFSIYEHEAASAALVDQFLKCVLQKKKFPISFSEAAYTTQICLSCIESYEKGRPVQVKRIF